MVRRLLFLQSSSLPEVVGDCAVFANPYDYRDIARALEKGLVMTSLCVIV